MSNQVYDSNGFVGDLCNATMWANFGAWARDQGGELAKFGAEGETEAMEQVVAELKAATPKDKGVDQVRLQLLEMLPKAADIAIVSES